MDGHGPAAVMRTTVRTVALLGAEVAAVVVLHRLGSAPGFSLPHHDPAGWLRAAPPVDATAALLRVVALGAAWWLLASTAWWLVAAARGAAHRAGALAMPGTRRLVEWTLTLTLAGGVTLTGPPAGATPIPTAGAPAATTTTVPTGGVRTGRSLVAVPGPVTTPTTGTTTGTTTGSNTGETAPPASPAPVTPATVATPGPDPVHVIVAGENLWSIAAAQVGARSGRPARAVPAAEVAPYWRSLCDLNRPSLRSGNPSLVFPGEVLRLPQD